LAWRQFLQRKSKLTLGRLKTFLHKRKKLAAAEVTFTDNGEDCG
jgi:hypothetical protein